MSIFNTFSRKNKSKGPTREQFIDDKTPNFPIITQVTRRYTIEWLLGKYRELKINEITESNTTSRKIMSDIIEEMKNKAILEMELVKQKYDEESNKLERRIMQLKENELDTKQEEKKMLLISKNLEKIENFKKETENEKGKIYELIVSACQKLQRINVLNEKDE